MSTSKVIQLYSYYPNRQTHAADLSLSLSLSLYYKKDGKTISDLCAIKSHGVITPPPIGSAEYCYERVCLFVCLSVCLSIYPSVCVCLSVYDHISGTTHPIFTIFVHVTYGRGSVLLWQRSDTLRISGMWMTSYLYIS